MICACEETLEPKRITPPTSPRRTRARRSPLGVRPAIETISFWPISWPRPGSVDDGTGVGLGVDVAAGRAGVGVAAGVGLGEAAAAAAVGCATTNIAVGEGEPVPPCADVGAAEAVAAGVGATLTGTAPSESALMPLSSAEPAITRAAMTTRALFIAYQTPGLRPFVHPIVLRIGEMNVSVKSVRLLV